ncbi:MAG: hypothetical protein QXD89_01925 [Candidatus Aenigmatarchaeota archaeon]
MRAQTQIVQFILFFLIGLSVFSAIYSFLFYHSRVVQSYTSSLYREIISNYISSSFIDLVVYCKECNFSSINFSVPNRVSDEPYEINLESFYVKNLISNISTPINSHRLNYTYLFEGGVFTSQYYFNITPYILVMLQFNKV